jgi:hypothetical protein
MRREFEMTEDDLKELLEASKPVPYMVFGGVEPQSPRENAHAVWRVLGDRIGFAWKTVKPSAGGQRFFSAEPSEDLPPLTGLVRSQRAALAELEVDLEEAHDAIDRIRSLHKRLTHTRRDGTVDEFCRECLDWPHFPCATLRELDKGMEEWLDKGREERIERKAGGGP